MDTGSRITEIPAGVVQQLKQAFPDIEMARMMNPPQSVRIADGRSLQATEMTCPVRIALRTSFGHVALDPFALAVMPETNNVVILRCPTLDMLGPDIYAGLRECTQQKVERPTKPMKSAEYIVCRRVSLSVEAMQQQPMDEKVLYQAVERVVELDPEMVMEPVVEETERRMALEQAVSPAKPHWIGSDSGRGGEESVVGLPMKYVLKGVAGRSACASKASECCP